MNSVRQVSEKPQSKLTAYEHLLDFLEEWVPQVLPLEYWTNVTDNDLVGMIKRQSGGGDPRVKEISAEIQQSAGAQDSESKLIIELLVQTSVGMEYQRRMQQRQTPDGKVLLEYVVQSSSESLRRLMPALTRDFRWHPLLASPNDAKEEIAAEASLALEERVSPLRNVPDPLNERMTAALDGRLNRIPDNVNHAVEEKLKSAKRRVNVNQPSPEQQDGTIEVDVPAPSSDHSQSLIMDDLLQSLSPKERIIIDMRLQGHTHKDIAQALGVTRPAISQALDRIRKRFSGLS